MPPDAFLLATGLVAGFLSGLLGIGGGFLLVPALVLAGWPMTAAVGMSLAFVTVMGLAGTASHVRNANVDAALVATAAVPAMIGAQVGAYAAAGVPGWALRAAFAAVLLYGAFEMVWGRREETGGRTTPLAGATIGGVVGVLSGLLGVGGGVLLVPAQLRWLGVPLKRAIGNSMALVVLTGVAGVAGHLALGHLDLRAGAWLVAGGMVGVQVGLLGLRWVSPEGLRRWFALLMVFLAIAMLTTR